MAVLAIPNPKKSTQVDFSIERVKISVTNIGLINNKYKFSNSNEIFNQYTYEALEFLSLGVYIDINLNKLGDEKTEITVEIRRKVGTFNESHEVTNANNHLSKVFECIAKLTAMNIDDIERLKNEQTVQKNNSKSKVGLNNSDERHWYDKTGLVIILCIFIFPVGIYALWKNQSISKGWKIAVTAIIGLIFIVNVGNKDKKNSDSSKKEVVTQTEGIVEINSVENKKTDDKRKVIIERLKNIAKRDWPNDFTTQEFWINQQIEAYEYMLNISDNPIKMKAEKDWPLDFTTQKFWYNEQVEAQERIK
ncbi:hypothetical protein [Flavobacterium sp.]|uniref:hypothetical protein n=1 Tax=Flavobacterium sp. TaxID=239 RepID=UPI004047FFDD